MQAGEKNQLPLIRTKLAVVPDTAQKFIDAYRRTFVSKFHPQQTLLYCFYSRVGSSNNNIQFTM